MEITKSEFFSILVNGSSSSTFSPSWRIRQGDLISLVIFILMVEGSSRTISTTMEVGNISGLKLHPLAPTTSHQQFVDNTMLMGKSTVKETKYFQTILQNFKLSLGLEVNLDKSQLFFFNTSLLFKHISHEFSKLLRVPFLPNTSMLLYLKIPFGLLTGNPFLWL